MKICSACGATYTDRIDFCFNDGSILAARAVSGADTALDVPIPQHLQSAAEPDDAPAADEPPVRRRRSLLGAGAAQTEQTASPNGGFTEPLQPIPVEPAVAEVEFEDDDLDPTPEPRPLPKRTTPVHDPISPSGDSGDGAMPWIEPPPPLASAAEPPPAEPPRSRPVNATLVPDFYATDVAPADEVTGPPTAPPPMAAAPASAARPSAARPEPPASSGDEEDTAILPASRSWLVPALVGGGLLAVVGIGVVVVVVGLGGFALSGKGEEATATASVVPGSAGADAAPAVHRAPVQPEAELTPADLAADSDAAGSDGEAGPLVEPEGEVAPTEAVPEPEAEQPEKAATAAAETPPPTEKPPVAAAGTGTAPSSAKTGTGTASSAKASTGTTPSSAKTDGGTASGATATSTGGGATPPKEPVVSAVVAPVESGGTADPVAQTGRVTFESTPAGASVKIDGESMGQTPLTLDLAYGGYVVEVLLDGHTTARKAVDVAQPNVKVPVTLERKLQSGKVFVALTGRDGQTLLVDGKPVGPLPASIDLVEGPHTFAVDNGDGTQFKVTREVTFTNGRAFIEL